MSNYYSVEAGESNNFWLRNEQIGRISQSIHRDLLQSLADKLNAHASCEEADDWMISRDEIDRACNVYNDQSMQLADAQYVCMGKALESFGFVVDWDGRK